ncbi:MAG: glycoside hydrolase family 3 C-terminal domain-containing protein [Clostridiales bacterium]|nr:glycoside hydrolase family 3 C-terminal domain-containing protein [Clostridiales bacterium]
MKSRKIVSLILAFTMIVSIASCGKKDDSKDGKKDTAKTEAPDQTEDPGVTVAPTDTAPSPTEPDEDTPPSTDRYKGMTAEQIVANMTNDQKAAQMVHGMIKALSASDMEEMCYGAVFSHFDEHPNLTPEKWKNTIKRYQEAALRSDAGIPFIYGQDAVHGVNFADAGVIFPHNVNVGAANDVELTERMGKIVGSDIANTHMIWNYAPCVAVAKDPRWGRTYESYSSEPSIVKDLSVAFTRGMLTEGIVACPKHFIGDGYVKYGTGEDGRLIDRGDAQMTDAEIEENLQIYKALIDEGAQTIMISHSSLNGLKMHEYGKYIMILKEEYGFQGFIVSDYESIHFCSGKDLRENTIKAINSGIDMLMEPNDYEECRQYIVDAVKTGEISQERLDDAATRIIRVKINAGLMDDPYLEDLKPTYEWNSEEAHEVARLMAAESYVPIKLGENYKIKPGMKIYVTGPAANDTGIMCGGWTYLWAGGTDDSLKWCATGVTVLSAMKKAAEEMGFEVVTDPSRMAECDMVLLCIGERPYAEWLGDTTDLSITGDMALDGNEDAIALAADCGVPTTTLIFAGRNVIVDKYIDAWDSCIMCYLPGSEGGNAVVDVLTGKVPFSGTLAMPYYSSVDQIGTGECWLDVGYTAAGW